MKIVIAFLMTAWTLSGQTVLSPKWDELTASDFVKAVRLSMGVCILPMGILEKHGPAGPIGTDLFDARFAVLSAVKEEYAVVFPEYFVGQIFEAQHQPGTVAYSTHLQMEFLQETTAEMARNGCTKIVLYSGHGGNNGLISYFTMTQLDKPKDWVLYTIGLGGGAPASGTAPNPATAPSKPGVDGHAGESEISMVMAARPELVHTERSGTQSGKNLQRLDLPAGVSTSISWYSMYPNHYAGDSAAANATRGQALQQQTIARLVAALRAIKADQVAPRLQKEFFDKTTKPLATQQ
ncbi:MAG TPA: creatininase family protein [Bryobacteraceae bacterium]|nr:creatininase family protein [Bryobacteraceae bacterium]